jgi:hypothetical protein
MGAKFWTPEEKQFFLDEILPRSRYARQDNDTGERLDWDQLAPIMQNAMDKKGGDRVYTKTSLFQHYYQKVGSRAQQRGEADTMTISKKQRAHNGARNAAQFQSTRRQNRDNGEYEDGDEYEDDRAFTPPARTPSPDLPPIPQSLTKKDTSQCLSKAGRPALFVEDTDDEAEENALLQLQAQQAGQSKATSSNTRKPGFIGTLKAKEHQSRNDESFSLGNDDFMDDDNDIPGRAEDEAWEVAQREKRKNKKQVKEPSKNRDRRSLNATLDDNEREVEEFVPRKRQILPKRVPLMGMDDDDETQDEAVENRLVDSQSKKSRPKGRQPNKAIPAGKARYDERNGFSLVDSDEDDRSAYQPRDRYSSSSSYYANQGMRSGYADPRQPRGQRTEQNYHYSSRGRESGRYAESSSMYGRGDRHRDNRVSSFAYHSERTEQRPIYGEPSSTDSYRPTQKSRESTGFNANYPGMGKFRLPGGPYPSSEYTNAYPDMGRTAEQGGFVAINPRSSYSARPQGYVSHPSAPSTTSRQRQPEILSPTERLAPRTSQTSAPSRSFAPPQRTTPRNSHNAAPGTPKLEPATPRNPHNAGTPGSEPARDASNG